MISSDLDNICDGNLEKLKEIPKSKITENLSKQLITVMEGKIKEIELIINVNENMYDTKYILNYNLIKKQNIENCILYLKKIK
jgi:hypothetical protein